MDTEMDVYDPRSGEELCIRNFLTGAVFSNLDHELLVIEGIGIPWEQWGAFIDEAVVKTSDVGLISVEPFLGGRRRVLNVLQAEFGELAEYNGSWLGYFSPTSRKFEKVMELWSSLGQYRSGKWCIGGATMKFSTPQPNSFFSIPRGRDSFSFASVLEEPCKIGCILNLDEMAMSTLVTRLFDGIDDWVAMIKQSL